VRSRTQLDGTPASWTVAREPGLDQLIGLFGADGGSFGDEGTEVRDVVHGGWRVSSKRAWPRARSARNNALEHRPLGAPPDAGVTNFGQSAEAVASPACRAERRRARKSRVVPALDAARFVNSLVPDDHYIQ
jgi:hypothetical protein